MTKSIENKVNEEIPAFLKTTIRLLLLFAIMNHTISVNNNFVMIADTKFGL
ncbi:MAG: hypothetical protein HKP06_01535 [Flavobacteriaceae bacterium]|nr:hypothetical protein [Flavobacteriaceae bacterium]